MNTHPSTSGCMPNELREHFRELGYAILNELYPDFGGVLIYMQRESSQRKAAYYISKPSAIEFVTSDELRRVLDFLEGSDILLRYVLTTSPLSPASRKLVWKNEINLWELQPPSVDVPSSIDDASTEKQSFNQGVSLATDAPLSPSDL